MIDRFEIRVPSLVEFDIPFTLEVRALDASGQVITSDSTTVIQITSPDTNIVFDANDDGTFSVGDNTITLQKGVALIPAKDLKGTSVDISVVDTQSRTGTRTFEYIFNCLILNVSPGLPEAGTGLEGAYQFFRERDSVLPESPDASLQEIDTPLVLQNEELLVFEQESFVFDASTLGQGNGTSIVTLTNTEDPGPDGTQSSSANRANYITNVANGNGVARFDGDDWYSLSNRNKPLLRGSGSFTIIAGVRLAQTGGRQTIFSQALNSTQNQGVLLRYNSGWEFVMTGDNLLTDLSLQTSTSTTNEVIYVLAERSGNNYLLQLEDNIPVTTLDTDTRQVSDEGALVGATSNDSSDFESNPTDFFAGDLLELLVLPGTLTPDLKRIKFFEFQDVWRGSTTGATSYITTLQTSYTFDFLLGHDDDDGTNVVRDYSGSSFHSLQRNAVSNQLPLVTDSGASYTYGPGASAWIPPSFDFTGTQHTFHFWVSTSETLLNTNSDKTLFFSSEPGLELFWETSTSSGSGAIGFNDGTTKFFSGVTLPRDGNPHMLTFIFGATSCELFLDGSSQGTQTYSSRGLLSGLTSVRKVGDEGTINIDVVAYKNVAQTSTDVTNIYNDGI